MRLAVHQLSEIEGEQLDRQVRGKLFDGSVCG
jgi:hypothetical protein